MHNNPSCTFKTRDSSTFFSKAFVIRNPIVNGFLYSMNRRLWEIGIETAGCMQICSL